MLLTWEKNKALICKRISENHSTLKILLKTKNDKFFLNDWINYHASIVGFENIIVADNGSNASEVTKLYNEYSDKVLIFFFEGHKSNSGSHNAIHDYAAFPELFDALAKSSTYNIFLDTDEFLTYMEAGKWYADKKILEVLEKVTDAELAIPTTWLFNIPGVKDKFHFDLEYLDEGIKWGKPIVPSAVQRKHEHTAHNIQFSKSLFQGNIPSNFYTLHFTKLYKQQRIDTNLNKLKARGYIQENSTIEFVSTLETSNIEDKNIALYLDEIKSLVKYGFDSETKYPYIKLQENGVISFSDEITKKLFNLFIRNGTNNYKQLLEIPLDADKQLLIKQSDNEGAKKLFETSGWLSLMEVASMSSLNFLEYSTFNSVGFDLILNGAGKVISQKILKNNSKNFNRQNDSFENQNLFFGWTNFKSTNDWGYPKEEFEIGCALDYLIRPWLTAYELEISPDIVLIKGRFRVAAFIVSLLYSKVGTIIYFDDYTNRNFYKVVEKFLKPTDVVGRMSKFLVPNSLNRDRLNTQLLHYLKVAD